MISAFKIVISLLSITVLFSLFQNDVKSSGTLTGADLLISENYSFAKNKNIALVCNHTTLLKNGTHLADTLNSLNDVNLKLLFGPEHGVRGLAQAGEAVDNHIDAKTKVPVISLYGKIRRPTKEMLKDIDLIIFDIQDIGARFYTYISTMYNVIYSSAEFNIPIIILDRPNPIGGLNVNGPIVKDGFKSFVGITDIPIVHGMTVGELAKLFKSEIDVKLNANCELTIVKMKNWERGQLFNETKMKWISPSPNMPFLETAIAYPGVCLVEGINVSEGRGTESPFLTIGAPYINSKELITQLLKYKDEGVSFIPKSFTPRAIPQKAMYPKYLGEKCNGIEIKISAPNKFNPLKFGVELIYEIHKLYRESFKFKTSIDRLYGSDDFRQNILSGITPDEIISGWENDLKLFKLKREKYLLY